MNGTPYPESPVIKDLDILKPSSSYKKNVILVLLSIFIFLLFYLVLVTVSFALLMGCLYLGFAIMAAKPTLITLAIGLGFFALGIMFFAFSIKFIFSIKRFENPYQKEITEKEQPILFSFLRRLSEESNVSFPKKVFITPDVNASVFFNSSFFNLLFPVAKNLEIGLGLINTLNISEFKAVIAHEFGHFSQKSLMASSYIYTVNRAIYNMVYEYDEWDKLISKWASVGGLLGLYALITFWLVERVRTLLEIAYKIININYLKLTRDMEFNADVISACLAGSKAAITALRKIDFADESYYQMSTYLQEFTSRGKQPKNIYKNHKFMIKKLTTNYKIPYEEGFPIINDDVIEKYLVKSRLIIKNQWASHPLLEEREKNIANLNLLIDTDSKPAWNLFSDAEKIQSEMSAHVYKFAFPEQKFSILTESEFENFVADEEKKFLISHRYNGFYLNGYICEIDLDQLIKENINKNDFGFDQVYNESNGLLIKKFLLLSMEKSLINQIVNDEIIIKFFEFDGVKYKRKEAVKIKEKLEQEYENYKKSVIEVSEKSFLLNFNLANISSKSEEYLKLYNVVLTRKNLLNELKQHDLEFRSISNDLYYKRRWSENQLKQLAKRISFFEAKFRSYIKSNDIKYHISKIVNTNQKNSVSNFADTKTSFNNPLRFEEEQYLMLSEIIYTIQSSLNKAFIQSLKQLTEYQLELNGLTVKSENQ